MIIETPVSNLLKLQLSEKYITPQRIEYNFCLIKMSALSSFLITSKTAYQSPKHF